MFCPDLPPLKVVCQELLVEGQVQYWLQKHQGRGLGLAEWGWERRGEVMKEQVMPRPTNHSKCIEHFVLVPHGTPDTATSLQSQTVFGNPTIPNQSELSGHPFGFSPIELPQVMSIIFTKVMLILALFACLHV